MPNCKQKLEQYIKELEETTHLYHIIYRLKQILKET